MTFESNDIGSHHRKVIRCKVGSAANALSLSRDNSRVVVAGRALLKIYGIDENGSQFREVKNLHVGRKHGLNMSSSDVAWCQHDENLIVTAATNGAVVAWDLAASNRSKQLVIFSEHCRTVTKVSFHPVEAGRVISGSQDSTMKMFDLRKKECTNTFNSRADGVRSVQFSPYNHFQFAASFDNGNVQVWDYRRENSFMTQFIAHKGSVYTLDWHPEAEEKNTLATGGRDRVVKVWDVSQSKVKETNNVPTTSSVASVRWRPNRRDQLATVSMMLDFSINVWDLRRKYVPFAYFDDHRDIPTGITWKNNDPSTLFSCSKDGELWLNCTKDALRPGDNTHTAGFDFSALGYIGLADESTNSYVPRAQSPTGYPKLSGMIFGGWKGGGGLQVGDGDAQSYSGPSSPTFSSYKVKKFLNARSSLSLFKRNNIEPTECEDLDDCLQPTDTVNEQMFKMGFIFAAENYVLDGTATELPFKDLCTHNSKVALQVGMSKVARTWLLLSEFYSKDVVLGPAKSSNVTAQTIPRTHSDVAADRNENKRPSLIIRKDESHGSQILYPATSGAESEFHSDEGRNEMEDYLTDIARGRHSEPDFYFSDDEAIPSYDGATSEADFLTDQEWGVMRVPSEAFDQKANLDIDSISKFGHVIAPSGVTNQAVTKRTILTAHGGRWHETSVPTRAESSSSPSPPPDGDSGFFSEKDLVVKPSMWPDPVEAIRESRICEHFKWFAEMNDVQTPVSMMLALSSYSTPCILPLEEAEVELWQSSYLGLLAKHQLWVQHAQVVKLSRVPSIRAMSASSTVHFSCRVCQRRMPNSNPWLCDRRSEQEHPSKPASCSLCNLTVKGLYTYCQGCSHGGHFHCIDAWMKTRKEKSTNCRTHCI